MGRADVLLRFLQLIEMDGPRDLDPYLEGLDADPEQRPLADQIVDRIIAGHDDLYAKYAQARKDVGAKNPYSSRDDKTTPGYDAQLGIFVSKWTQLETIARNMDYDPNIIVSDRLQPKRFLFIVRDTLPKDLLWEFDYVRRFRNNVVHGIENPSRVQLAEAADFLERIIQILRERMGNDDA